MAHGRHLSFPEENRLTFLQESYAASPVLRWLSLWRRHAPGSDGMSKAAPRAAVQQTGFWWRVCGEQVRLPDRTPLSLPQRDAFYVATANTKWLGPWEGVWHTAKPTDQDPVLRREADEIEAEHPEVTVSVRFRFLTAAPHGVAP
jgi:hypothetical protein